MKTFKQIVNEAKKYTIYKDEKKGVGVTYTVYQGNKMVGQFLGDEPEFKKIKAQGEMKDGIKESKKLFVFASWENGVLKWRTDKADNRTGSDPMKKKPSEADVKKHLEKVLGTKVDLDFRLDESTELFEALDWLAVWQGDHKSSIGWSDKPDDPNGGKAFVSGNIPHNAPFMFDRKEVPKIIKLLKMKNSPLVKG